MQKLKQWWLTSETANKVRSFFWHAACVAALSGLNDLSAHLDKLSLPQWVATGLGLGFAQLIHALDNKVGLLGAKQGKLPPTL